LLLNIVNRPRNAILSLWFELARHVLERPSPTVFETNGKRSVTVASDGVKKCEAGGSVGRNST
jgi:hypothetical protein